MPNHTSDGSVLRHIEELVSHEHRLQAQEACRRRTAPACGRWGSNLIEAGISCVSGVRFVPQGKIRTGQRSGPGHRREI